MHFSNSGEINFSGLMLHSALLGDVINKAINDRAKAILIAPSWKTSSWWPSLQKIVIAEHDIPEIYPGQLTAFLIDGSLAHSAVQHVREIVCTEMLPWERVPHDHLSELEVQHIVSKLPQDETFGIKSVVHTGVTQVSESVESENGRI